MNDLRFPIGRFQLPPVGDHAHVAACTKEIATLPALLRGTVHGLDDAALDTPYRDGGWSVRQLVHHVADSHLNALTRIKLALTEEHPTICGYDQDAWVALPDARQLAIGPSLDILDGLHARWTMLIESFGNAELARTYLHPEHNKSFTVGQTIAMYAWHGNHHTAHIRALRERKGW